MNAADMRETLSVVGYHLDVVSLAKASMVCRIWNAAFGNHPKWKEFYLNSDEYLQDPLDKKGPWRILYGELFNKCKSLMQKRWQIEYHQPGLEGQLRYLPIHDSFFVDGKLVIIADNLFFMLKNQLKAPNMQCVVDKDPYFPLKQPYCLISIPNEMESSSVHCILDTLIDRDFFYASANDGQLLRWERSRFPSGCTRVFKKALSILDFKIQNQILYILNRKNNNDRKTFLYAFKNSEELWGLDITQGWNFEIKVNKNIGIIFEKIKNAFGSELPGEVYLWDTFKGEIPKHVGKGWHHVLMNNEVIYADGYKIVAHSLKGSRIIYDIDNEDVDAIIPNCDQNLIYIIIAHHYLLTFSLSNEKVISNIDIGTNCIDYKRIKFFNGILYCVDDNGRLLLIDPKKGIIRTGPEKMLEGQIEVHNGRVHGLSPNRETAVIIYPEEKKSIRNKKCIIC